MLSFVHRTRVEAPLEAVAVFHKDAKALKHLTPPPVFVQMHRVEPLTEASVADFTLWLGPLPVHWVASHHNVDPLRGFTDVQADGPFATWTHRHTFIPVNDTVTEVVDEVQAEYGRHSFWGLVSRLIWLNLPLMFAYRGLVTRRLAPRIARSGARSPEPGLRT
jgi:ligand-binding SRPBCC domain-containing protein